MKFGFRRDLYFSVCHFRPLEEERKSQGFEDTGFLDKTLKTFK